MQISNKYKYPSIIVISALVLGWFYLSFILEGVDEKIVSDQAMLDEYSNRMNFIESLVTKTDLFEGKIYKSLTDEFEEGVMTVGIGKNNPFRPF